MKINSIQLNCRRETAFGGELGADYVLLYFRSPVMYTEGGRTMYTAGRSAALLTSGYKSAFSPLKGQSMRYDLVSFKTSAADRQYISSMNLPLDAPIDIADDFAIASALRSMKSQSMHRGRHYSEFMELYMRIIFIALSDAADPPRQSPEENIPRYGELKRIREAVYDDPLNNWSVNELCDDMQISRSYFHRLYFTAFGVTFRQDVIESRLIRAAQLLKNTDMSVTAISETCGYDSESYFMRQFKKHKGCTPTEYRRRSKESYD